MRQHIINMAMSLLGILCMTSCEKEEQYWVTDYIPFTINITVSDKNGTDLLNPNDEGTIYNEGIKAFYEGKEYEVKRDESELGSRAILVQFYGLRLVKGRDGIYMLSFGEFEGTQNFDDFELTIDWNNGKPLDVIKVKRTIWWPKSKKPFYESETQVSLNGKNAGVDSSTGPTVIIPKVIE